MSQQPEAGVGRRVDTDHVHDLDEAEREDHGQGLRVVGHRPLHPVVVFQQVLQQAPLVGALQRHWEERATTSI